MTLCKYYLRGNCYKGFDCRFEHTRNVPNDYIDDHGGDFNQKNRNMYNKVNYNRNNLNFNKNYYNNQNFNHNYRYQNDNQYHKNDYNAFNLEKKNQRLDNNGRHQVHFSFNQKLEEINKIENNKTVGFSFTRAFDSLQDANSSFQVDTPSTSHISVKNVQDTISIYSNMHELNEVDKCSFIAKSFDLKKIPLMPPPKECC